MAASWGEITAQEMLSPLRGTLVLGRRTSILSGISTDSRKIKPGELFWALRGEFHDGHDFALRALEGGAAGLVVQKEWWRSKADSLSSGFALSDSYIRSPVVIVVDDTLEALGDLAGWWRRRHDVLVSVITGSAGKTTTKEMAAGILELRNRVLKNRGNLNNLIGLPVTLLRMEKRCEVAALEMGTNRFGEIARLTEIADPDVGVITNVGMAHLEGFGDLEGVARAKLELVDKISLKGKVVLNGDDEFLMKMASPYTREVVTFGIGKKSDVRADQIRDLGRKGVSFRLGFPGGSLAVKLKVPGLQNVSNALAAASVAFCLNEPPEYIAEGLGLFAGIGGRFAMTRLPGDVVLVDDTYNANPLALRAALVSVKSLVREGSRIIVGLGEMTELGDATVLEHREAGRRVAELGAHFLLAVGAHAHELVKGAVDAGMRRDQAEVVTSHDEMTNRIREEAKGGDLIFLKGSRKIGLERVVEGLKARLN